MAFTVEQACPQCGAPIELEETDRLLQCPFCRVKSFLFARDYFRYVLPNKNPDRETIYAPYLRFKGAVYAVGSQGIANRILDITKLSASVRGLPVSLGVRSQVLKLKFLGRETGGTFLPASLGMADILSRVAKQTSESGSLNLFHRAYIGEVVSQIFLPLFVEKETVFDGITKKALMKVPEGQDLFESAVAYQPRWELSFMGTLCPQCGWNLDGERNSCVLTCHHCRSAWEASDGRFRGIRLAMVRDGGRDAVYLPFWRFGISSTGISIDSYADFLRITNQPKVIQKAWETRDMNFWSPAFKIWPDIFLRVSSQLTIAQRDFEMEEQLPEGDLQPVTLPQSEAVQSLKLILARSAYTKRKTFPLLPEVEFKVRDATLIYIPFADKGLDFVHQEMRLSINKNALVFGRSL